jgi:toxin ParE1/3/4
MISGIYLATTSGSVDIADRQSIAFTDRFLLLARHPHIGRPRDEDLRPGLRSFTVGKYLIFYRVEGEDVLILRVLHGRRDIESIFQD